MRIETRIVQEEVYSFTPTNGEPEVHIWSGRLRRWLLENATDKVIDLTFPVMSEAEMFERHGLEQPRLDSMTALEAADPVVVGFWSDGTNILIDGAHRVAFWQKQGINTIRGWAVPEPIWRDYCFDPNTAGLFHHRDGSTLPQRSGK